MDILSRAKQKGETHIAFVLVKSPDGEVNSIDDIHSTGTENRKRSNQP
jgi:hypothetical protein